MKNAKITRKNATVSATYLPYAAYKRASELALEYKGEIGTTAEGLFKATFANAKTAEKFVTQWTAEYNANRKVDLAPTKATAPTKKPTASKGKAKTVTVTVDGVEYTIPASALVPAQKSSTSKPKADKPSSTKKTTAPRKAKGEAFDFNAIKGKTTSDKNRALHKELVKMGLKDSRTPEYMSIWNARPWAK